MRSLWFRRWMLALLVGGAMLCLQGCISVGEEDPKSVLPSTRPGSWDGKTLTMPL